MKLLRLAVALACIPVAATIVAAGPLGVQTASAAPKPPIECQSMSESNPTAPFMVSGCNRRGITGGSGTLGSCPIGTLTCLTWSTGSETNFTLSESSPSTNRCPAGLYENDFVGTVVSRSGYETKRLIGAPVAFDVCTPSLIHLLVELVPGTLFTIG
jgi:hypothetical protein